VCLGDFFLYQFNDKGGVKLLNTKIHESAEPIIFEMEGDILTPISIFQRLKGRKKFLLESSYKHEDSGRYSFIGADPYLEMKSVGGKTVIRDLVRQKVTETKTKIIELIPQHLTPNPDLQHLPFYGGAIGYIGYDVIRQYEKIGKVPPDDLQMPDAHLMFYEKVVIMDHLQQKIYISLLNLSGSKTREQLDEEMTFIKKQLMKPAKEEFKDYKLKTYRYQSNMGKQEFMKQVEKAKEYITRGDIFQVVLSQRLQTTFSGDAFAFYRKLRKFNPSPYMFYIDFEEYLVLGASPESLIKVQNGEVITNPIAGTRKRGSTETMDYQLEQELLSDEKELAEHRMLVDLSRNDLGKVCEFGSVTLTKYMKVEWYKHVMHIVSEVKGKLRKGFTSLDALTACLPAGTVSGAPKIRAMQIINELEKVKRGVYSGAIGYVNVNGELDFALAIRMMVIKGNQAYVQAGAGIVLDSDPKKEYEETLNKAKTLLEVGE
jgi:anthranilate synthase component I